MTCIDVSNKVLSLCWVLMDSVHLWGGARGATRNRTAIRDRETDGERVRQTEIEREKVEEIPRVQSY